MRKQSSGHRVDRQDVTTVTPFPGNSQLGSKPHGVHAGGGSKPTQLSAGAAESNRPVELPNRGNRSTESRTGESRTGESRTGSTKSRTH